MKLVIGANGFLGSHVVRRLVADGEHVRVLTRKTSDTRPIDKIPATDGQIERVTGDLFDQQSLDAAMRGVDDVFHCAVDTRAWLIDPAPLFRANVDGLRNVLDAAAAADLGSFVFASTIGTIGNHDRVVAETDEFNWGDVATDYIKSRVAAENLALGYARDGKVPVRAMCVANTYGPYDWKPTNHGIFVKGPALGRFPFRTRGMATESVAVDDAALAMTLAAERARITSAGRAFIEDAPPPVTGAAAPADTEKTGDQKVAEAKAYAKTHGVDFLAACKALGFA